jgi:hypothetical protein
MSFTRSSLPGFLDGVDDLLLSAAELPPDGPDLFAGARCDPVLVGVGWGLPRRALAARDLPPHATRYASDDSIDRNPARVVELNGVEPYDGASQCGEAAAEHRADACHVRRLVEPLDVADNACARREDNAIVGVDVVGERAGDLLTDPPDPHAIVERHVKRRTRLHDEIDRRRRLRARRQGGRCDRSDGYADADGRKSAAHGRPRPCYQGVDKETTVIGR